MRIDAAAGARPLASPGSIRNLSIGWQALLAAIALLAVALPALIVARAPHVHPRSVRALLAQPKRVVPKTELPPVEPVQVVAISPEDARAYNASIPFSTLPNPAAKPFHIFGSADDQARALDCLAAAELYEAGDDTVGERAVAQVVLNRVRHPAFPKSVCGVVFQGSERSTGCQFTFSCDGALQRWSPNEAAWNRARDVARMALNGNVYKPVGHATHYHTDWVVPYWSSSLEKITEVGTHLFFRWAGWWGTPPAFNRGYAGAEPDIALLSRISKAHAAAATDAETVTPTTGIAETAANLDAIQALGDTAIPGSVQNDPDTFLVVLDKKLDPSAYAALAVRTCGDRPRCKFMGWTDAKARPAGLPLTGAAMLSMSFSYLRDQQQQFAKALWNCDQFRRPSPLQCMRQALIARPDNAPPVESYKLQDLKPKAPAPEPKASATPVVKTSQALPPQSTEANASGQ